MKKIVIRDKTLITEKMLPDMLAVIDILNEAVDMLKRDIPLPPEE